MRFVLVCEAAGDATGLSETGTRQARATAEELKTLAARGERFAAVLAGRFAASLATAAPIAEALELRDAEPRGELSGAEDAPKTQVVAWGLIEALKQRFEMDQTIVLVAGEQTVRLLVCRALSMPVEDARRFQIQPASLTAIDYRTLPRERTLLASLNEVCHLEALSV